jgi:hypothetical protein
VAPARTWAADRFAAVGQQFLSSKDGTVLLFGSPNERPVSDRIASTLKGSVINLVERLALQQYGELRCEVCGFSFGETYGDRAKDYIEGHHRKAVSEMQPGDTTAVEDIAMLCSNCHRTIHAKFPYISVDELRGMLRPRS